MTEHAERPEPTVSIRGDEWPLTAPVRAYLEYLAVTTTGLESDDIVGHLVWEPDGLYIRVPNTDVDSKILDPEETLSTMLEAVGDASYWGWLRACDLVETAEIPTGVTADEETVYATRVRISQAVVWAMMTSRNVSDVQRTYAREFLGRFTPGEWRVSIEADPKLAEVQTELGL